VAGDGTAIYILLERGRRTHEGNLFGGHVVYEAQSYETYRFDRGTRKLTRLSAIEVAKGSKGWYGKSEAFDGRAGGAPPLADCRAIYNECAATTVPKPFTVGQPMHGTLRAIDAQSGVSIGWDGRRLKPKSLEHLTETQVRNAGDAEMKRTIAAVYVRAKAHFDKQLAQAVDAASVQSPTRVIGDATGKHDFMHATYRIVPGQQIDSRFSYPGMLELRVLWRVDGPCRTQSAAQATTPGPCAQMTAEGRPVSLTNLARELDERDATAKGMTWGVVASEHQVNGVALVSCHGQPNINGSCDAYQGDTSCRTALPVLCLKPEGLGPPVAAGGAAREPPAWTGARLALTAPVRGTDLRSVADANTSCHKALGTGWRVAEFHDSRQGWTMSGLGQIDNGSRFWVHINDQRANCWR
jgi:hypothetical protein